MTVGWLGTGVVDFLKDAQESGARMGVICGTLSSPNDDVWNSVSRMLGPDLCSHIVPFTTGRAAANLSNTDQRLESHIQSRIKEASTYSLFFLLLVVY